jgi:ABC-type uncharacterized transport system YnjBCD permease subunit
MDLALLVYGISLLVGLKTFLIFLAVIAGMIAVGCSMYTAVWFFEASEYPWNMINGEVKPRIIVVRDTMKKGMKYFTILFFILLPLPNLIPSEKTAYTMVGAYAAQQIATDQRTAEISGKVLTLINQQLDSYIEEGIKKVK